MHTFDHPPDYDGRVYSKPSDLIPIPTIMSAWVEHGEFVHLWFCALNYGLDHNIMCLTIVTLASISGKFDNQLICACDNYFGQLMWTNVSGKFDNDFLCMSV